MPNGHKTRVALWIITGLGAGLWIYIALRGGPLALAGMNLEQRLALWVTSIVVVLVLAALAGHEVNRQWLGVLIDDRNKISLARLQIALWTVMIMTAYVVIALWRIVATNLAQQEVLEIAFPPELLLAMGISATSFAGASLIKRTKTAKTTTIEEKSSPEAATQRRDTAKSEFDAAEAALLKAVTAEADAKQALDTASAAVAAAVPAALPAAQAAEAMAKTLRAAALQDKQQAAKDRDDKKKIFDDAEQDLAAITEAQGRLHRNADPSEASWVDLVRGEEIGNYKLVDMSKVQMLFFTVVVIVAYAAGIVDTLQDDKIMTMKAMSFPPFGDTLNALLGISHGTYLSVKAVDHS